MAKIVRKPPSPSDHKDPRSQEYFFQDLYDQGRMAATTQQDLPAISAGGTTAFTLSVKGAVPDKGQTVECGVPSAWVSGLSAFGWVSAVDTVTVAVTNTTGSTVNLGAGTYGVRVKP
jgi:hypothetical protein